MPVREITTIACRPGRGDELGERLTAGLKTVAAESGCSAVHVRRSIERPDEYLVDVSWSSPEAVDAWHRQPGADWRDLIGRDIVEAGPLGVVSYGLYANEMQVP